MRRFALILMMPLALFAQQLVSEFKIDTAQYEYPSTQLYIMQVPGADAVFNTLGSKDRFSISYGGLILKKKNSDQYDIFSYTGKTGSLTIPQTLIDQAYYVFISQTILDSDNGWEILVDCMNNGPSYTYTVLDDNNSVLLADSGFATYGYDGQNTYICAQWNGYKIWRFRTNLSQNASQPLAKSAVGTPGPIMSLMPSGDLRVSLQPAAGGTSIQIFDFLGRQIFQKTVSDIKKTTTFTIPSSDIPNSPFITKVNNEKGSFVQKKNPAK